MKVKVKSKSDETKNGSQSHIQGQSQIKDILKAKVKVKVGR